MRCNLRVDEFPDAELAKLWREPITLMEIAARLGVMEWDVVRVARRMRLPSRKRCKKSSNLSVRDPTKMEITQRMLEVQATWCEAGEVSQHCWRRKLLAPPRASLWEVGDINRVSFPRTNCPGLRGPLSSKKPIAEPLKKSSRTQGHRLRPLGSVGHS